MKLTRSELIHAQDRQLAAIGLRRSGNSGWLERAVAAEFTDEQVRLFKEIRKESKAAARKAENVPQQIDPFANSTRMNTWEARAAGAALWAEFKVTPGDDLLAFLLEKLSDIDAAAALATDDTVRETVRRMVASCWAKVREVNPPGIVPLNAMIPGNDHAEDFANELFEQTGRDLS